MHECPRCGQACYCSGDIDDCPVYTEAWVFEHCECPCDDDGDGPDPDEDYFAEDALAANPAEKPAQPAGGGK